MELSKLKQWVGLVGLSAVLGGCVVVSDDEGTTVASAGPVTTSGPSMTSGSDEDSGTEETGDTTEGADGDSTTGGMDCDPPCPDGEICVMGQCFDDGMGDDTTGDPPPPPPENSEYGPCNACAAGESPVQIMGLEGCFCSPMCDGAGSMCPAPNDGTAMAVCTLELMMGAGPSQCALVCDPAGMGMCPAGATCQDTGMMGVGLCTHPAP